MRHQQFSNGQMYWYYLQFQQPDNHRDSPRNHQTSSRCVTSVCSALHCARVCVVYLCVHFSRFKQEFEDMGCLGYGGFGGVFKVKDKVLQKLFAIKIVQSRRWGWESCHSGLFAKWLCSSFCLGTLFERWRSCLTCHMTILFAFTPFGRKRLDTRVIAQWTVWTASLGTSALLSSPAFHFHSASHLYLCFHSL